MTNRNQEMFNTLAGKIRDLGSALWETREEDIRINLLNDKTRLEISADGYIKYDHRGLTTPESILGAMTKTLNSMIEEVNDRVGVLTSALEAAKD